MNEVHSFLSASNIILCSEDSVGSDVTEFKVLFEKSSIVFHEVSVHLGQNLDNIFNKIDLNLCVIEGVVFCFDHWHELGHHAAHIHTFELGGCSR